MFAPTNEPILEERQVEHRQPLARLEQDERDEQDGRRDEEAEDLGDAQPCWLPSISA